MDRMPTMCSPSVSFPLELVERASTYLNGHADQIVPRAIKLGDRVRLLDDNQGYGAVGAEGVVIGNLDFPEVRFDNAYGESRGHTWFVDMGFANCELVDIARKSPAMDQSASTTETTMDDNNRPRFMTAWMADTDEAIHPTGEVFMTLEDADNFAQTVLAFDKREGQIAVFEIRSVHLSRLQITRETA